MKCSASSISSSRHAYTLVELMVVLAIVALLSAVLMPVLASVREKGRRSSCSANLRQLGMAFQMYVSDNDGQHPPRFENLQRSGLIKEEGVRVCPSDPTRNWGGLVYEGQRPTFLPPETSQYSYVSAFNMPDWEWQALMASGANAGILVCQVHGRGTPALLPFAPSINDYEGTILRLQTDGAVVTRQTHWTYVPTETGPRIAYGNFWSLFCDDQSARHP